jgi:hypothetical protein
VKLLIFPATDDQRLAKIRAAAGAMQVRCAGDQARAIADLADALVGKITPGLLAAAGKLRWVQVPAPVD